MSAWGFCHGKQKSPLYRSGSVYGMRSLRPQLRFDGINRGNRRWLFCCNIEKYDHRVARNLWMRFPEFWRLLLITGGAC